MKNIFYIFLIIVSPLCAMSEFEEMQHLPDYKILLGIKKHLLELAPTIKRDYISSSITLAAYPSDRHTFANVQTEQGFALLWEADKPRGILWKFGLFECVAGISVIKDGDILLKEKIIKEFDAVEISRAPRLLPTRDGKEFPIGNQEIIIYGLRKLKETKLPQVAFKEEGSLTNSTTAKRICKALQAN